MLDAAIRNPADPTHFMRLKPVGRLARVSRGDAVLAESRDALRLLEHGRDLYDPVVYFPREHVAAALKPNPRASHCPLKGDAAYFDLVDAAGAVVVEAVAWSYPSPLPFAAELAGRVAFYADRVTLAEGDL